MSRPALVLPALIAIAASVLGVCQIRSAARFTRFVAVPLPQHAIGDFDGDGQLDVARIGIGAGRHDISVTLSGADDDVRLDGSVAALIEGDVDHDGDLDLLASTASGEILVWVNDGHGRFTRQAPSPRHTIAGEPFMAAADGPSAAAVLVRAPGVAAHLRARQAVIAVAVRPPTRARAIAATRRLLPPLRAPPIARL